MEQNDANQAVESRRDAVVEVLLTPGEGSFVDALLALADDAANGNGQGSGERALIGGFQAALARRMRAAIAQDGASGRAA